MNAENCVCCRFCEKQKTATKPRFMCKYGRFANLGYPIAWLKKCVKEK